MEDRDKLKMEKLMEKYLKGAPNRIKLNHIPEKD